MRRAREDYEDKAMSTRQPAQPSQPSQPPKPAPAGSPVDVRPSERELAEQREQQTAAGTPRPSERELAEEREQRAKEQQAAAETTKEPAP